MKKQKNLGQKIPNWCIFGVGFENNIVIFEIRILEYVQLLNFVEKQICLTFGPKMPFTRYPNLWQRTLYFSIFGQEVQKNYCQMWNQHLSICLIAKYCEIMKWLKFGAKKALFGYFLARILKKLLFYLKLAPSNYYNWKLFEKKCLNLRPKISFLGIFDKKYLTCVFFGKDFKIFFLY